MKEKKLRDVLFAPWRYGYIKKGTSNNNSSCVFCEALQNASHHESLVLFQGKFSSVILNKYPYNNGHTMIIPHAHAQRLTDISDEASSEVHKLLILTQKILTEEYKPGGFNIGMNVGRTGGAGIAEHLHYHIVPRWDGDSNFMPILGGTKVVSESLEQTFNRLKPAFQKHAKQLEEQGPDISLDHVGIAVSSHKEAYSFWNVIGWKQDAHPETVADQKVRVAMLPVTNRARVELLEPTDAESPISKFVSKRGPGIHHLCFRVTDIEAQLKKLKDSGIKLINEAPVAGAHGCKVAFIHPSSTGGVLVELSEKANEGQL